MSCPPSALPAPRRTMAFLHSSSTPPTNLIGSFSLSRVSAEGMLKSKTYFRNGELDKDALVNFIKDVKKNTKLSDEDAAILAASK